MARFGFDEDEVESPLREDDVAENSIRAELERLQASLASLQKSIENHITQLVPVLGNDNRVQVNPKEESNGLADDSHGTFSVSGDAPVLSSLKKSTAKIQAIVRRLHEVDRRVQL